MESLEGEFKLKSTNVAKYIRNLEHTLEGIKEVESKMHQKRASLEKKIGHMREYLRHNLEKSGVKKIDSPEISIAIQKNPYKVVITNEKEIPAEFVDSKATETINKEKLKEALKSGIEIPGCELVQENRLTIK